MSKSDYLKRQELLAEFIYYIFDSFLIPLVRSNFHVTESNVHKNRLFYFRHDIWQMLTEPCLRSLKTSMFEELKQCTAKTISEKALGVSQVRLVPKAVGARPVMNLRKRQQIVKYGRTALGASINSLMRPAFDVLKLEKVRFLQYKEVPENKANNMHIDLADSQTRGITLFCWRYIPKIANLQDQFATTGAVRYRTIFCEGGRSIMLRQHTARSTSHDGRGFDRIFRIQHRTSLPDKSLCYPSVHGQVSWSAGALLENGLARECCWKLLFISLRH